MVNIFKRIGTKNKTIKYFLNIHYIEHQLPSNRQVHLVWKGGNFYSGANDRATNTFLLRSKEQRAALGEVMVYDAGLYIKKKTKQALEKPTRLWLYDSETNKPIGKININLGLYYKSPLRQQVLKLEGMPGINLCISVYAALKVKRKHLQSSEQLDKSDDEEEKGHQKEREEAINEKLIIDITRCKEALQKLQKEYFEILELKDYAEEHLVKVIQKMQLVQEELDMLYQYAIQDEEFRIIRIKAKKIAYKKRFKEYSKRVTELEQELNQVSNDLMVLKQTMTQKSAMSKNIEELTEDDLRIKVAMKKAKAKKLKKQGQDLEEDIEKLNKEVLKYQKSKQTLHSAQLADGSFTEKERKWQEKVEQYEYSMHEIREQLQVVYSSCMSVQTVSDEGVLIEGGVNEVKSELLRVLQFLETTIQRTKQEQEIRKYEFNLNLKYPQI